MAPRVKLVLYPDGDHAFASHASVGLTIDVPATYSATEVVAAVESHLRAKYPLAVIRVGTPTDREADATWHVYRDGLPAGSAAV